MMVKPHIGHKLAELLTIDGLHRSGDAKHQEDLVHDRDNRICRGGVHDCHCREYSSKMANKCSPVSSGP